MGARLWRYRRCRGSHCRHRLARSLASLGLAPVVGHTNAGGESQVEVRTQIGHSDQLRDNHFDMGPGVVAVSPRVPKRGRRFRLCDAGLIPGPSSQA
jgi:hypothetical protein